MDTKQMRNVLLFSLLIFHSSLVLFAQNAGYSLDTSGGEPRFTQRLSWFEEEYASRYEVIIEKEEGGRYRELRREFTTELFIEVSLEPGKYRCYAIPYDFMGQPGTRSEMYIEVLAALLPELDDSLAEFVYPADAPVFEMNFSGKNIAGEAEIYLRRSGDAVIAGTEIVPSELRIREDGSEFQLLFDKEQLLSGDYELFVKNPGGLSASRGVTVVVQVPDVPELDEPPELAYAPPKKLNLFLGAAWMPSVTMYDKGNRFFNEKWSPLGAVIRIGIVSAKPGVINLGAELTEAFSAINDGSGRRAMHIDPAINFLMQKWSPGRKTALTFRLGVGFSLPLFSSNDDRPTFTDLLFANIGVSMLGFVWNDLYLEGGIDFAHWFGRPFSGNFRPWLGIGMRF